MQWLCPCAHGQCRQQCLGVLRPSDAGKSQRQGLHWYPPTALRGPSPPVFDATRPPVHNTTHSPCLKHATPIFLPSGHSRLHVKPTTPCIVLPPCRKAQHTHAPGGGGCWQKWRQHISFPPWGNTFTLTHCIPNLDQAGGRPSTHTHACACAHLPGNQGRDSGFAGPGTPHQRCYWALRQH